MEWFIHCLRKKIPVNKCLLHFRIYFIQYNIFEEFFVFFENEEIQLMTVIFWVWWQFFFCIKLVPLQENVLNHCLYFLFLSNSICKERYFKNLCKFIQGVNNLDLAACDIFNVDLAIFLKRNWLSLFN